jgi:hypothetical protein
MASTTLWTDGWTYVSLALFVALMGIASWRCVRFVRGREDSEFACIALSH